MNSLFVLLTISSIAKIAENSKNMSFNYEYLPNGCKFEQTYDYFREYPVEIFVCNDLDKRFDFDQNVIKTCKKNPNSSTKVYFRLHSDKVLDRSINFSSIDNFLNKVTKFRTDDNEIKFKGIIGFDLNLQTSLDPSYKGLAYLTFLDSRFEFYYNNKLISSCEDFTRLNLTEPKSVFQLGTKTRQVGYTFENTRFPNSVCPFFFNNIQVNTMTFVLMIKTFYKSNFLKFSSNYNSIQQNSYVKRLYMENIEKIDIDSYLLNENVFKNIITLSIDGEINSIKEGIFKSFTYLRTIYLELNYFENLIQKGAKWISSINHGLHINLSNQTQLKLNINRLVKISVDYKSRSNIENEILTVLVHDEDFCLFKDFPFDQMVLLLIHELTKRLNNLSCTLVWLIKDFHFYYKYVIDYWDQSVSADNITYLNIYQEGNWTEMVEKCDFTKRIENCERGQRLEYKPKWSDEDTKEIVILIEFLFIFIIPLVGLFGLLTNIFIVYSVSLVENKEYLKAKQYSYMRISSLANALVCLISIFTPMYQCQSFEGIFDGIFCSSVHHLVFTQYFRIICVEFISSVLKMFSNFSYVGFLINRSSLIGKNHGKFIQVFSELSIVKFTSASLFLSVIFSIVKIFQYQVNTFEMNRDYPIPFDRNLNNIFSPGFEVKSRLISIFNAISDLINYILFIFFNLILDICLLVKLKKTLTGRINSTSSSNNQDVINRAITSVVSYTLFCIVFKVPASIKSVFYSASFNDNFTYEFAYRQINYLYEIFCVYCRICPMFELLAYLLFIFSISFNIFFFFMFDNRFKIGVKIAHSKLFSSQIKHLEYLKNLEESLKSKNKIKKKRTKN